MRYKKIITIVLIALVLLSAIVTLQSFINRYSKPPHPLSGQPTNQNIVVFQAIVLKENDKEEYSRITLVGKTTALDLLKQKAKVITQGEAQMAFVVEIDSIKAFSKKKEYWAFYVNDRLAQVGAGSYILKNNDHILWKIAKY